MTLDKYKKIPYSLEDPSYEFTSRFVSLKPKLEKVFGAKALDIEHVGSTSLGIKAKPVLDVVVVVERIEEIAENEKRQMHELEYQFEENYIAPRTVLFFKQETDGRRLQNIHVCERGSNSEQQFIVVRDYFRAHPDKAKEYEELKARLNAEFPDDYPAYRAGKSEFLQDIQKQALIWKAGSNPDR